MAEQNEKIVALYVRVSTGYQVDKEPDGQLNIRRREAV